MGGFLPPVHKEDYIPAQEIGERDCSVYGTNFLTFELLSLENSLRSQKFQGVLKRR